MQNFFVLPSIGWQLLSAPGTWAKGALPDLRVSLERAVNRKFLMAACRKDIPFGIEFEESPLHIFGCQMTAALIYTVVWKGMKLMLS